MNGPILKILRHNARSYKVALPDRLVEVREEEAVPVLAEGDAAGWRRGGRGSVEPVRVVLVNDMSWWVRYLVPRTSEPKSRSSSC